MLWVWLPGRRVFGGTTEFPAEIGGMFHVKRSGAALGKCELAGPALLTCR
jgi:hypothetical protein